MLNDITNEYPQIYYPTIVQEISNKKIRYSDVFPNSKPKREDFISTTVIPKQDNVFGNILGYGCLLYIIFLIIGLTLRLVIFLFSLDIAEDTGKNIIIITFTCIVLLGLIVKQKLGDFDKKELSKKRHKEFVDYNLALKDYEEKVQKWQTSEKDKIEKVRRINDVLKSKRSQIFQNIKIVTDNNVQKGESEKFFQCVMEGYSKAKLYCNTSFGYYYPDFIAVKDDLIINIEIDEPYSFNLKAPIHYENSDENRNLYFKNEGIMVVRFTENQIIKNPLMCIDFIDSVILNCKTLSKFNKSVYNKLREKKWTYEEGFNYAYDESRNKVRKLIKEQMKYLELD